MEVGGTVEFELKRAGRTESSTAVFMLSECRTCKALQSAVSDRLLIEANSFHRNGFVNELYVVS